MTSLGGKTVAQEKYGDRIAWSLKMDHRFYRDLSKVSGDPVPFCPFVQFIGPGMVGWSTGWETRPEFRSLPRSVKHFFWYAVFGDRKIDVEPNGDSVFFNRDDVYSPGELARAMEKLERQKDRLAALWQCISDPESFTDGKVPFKLDVTAASEKNDEGQKSPDAASGEAGNK